MPSEMMDPKGFSSSSFFTDEAHLPNEIQVGFWKTGSTPSRYGAKVDAGLQTAGRNSAHSSPQSIMSLESQLVKSVELPDSYLMRDHKANLSLEKHAVGAERAAGYSLRRPVDHRDSGTRSSLIGERTSYFMQGDKIRATGAQGENGLFSSSLSEIFSRKLRLTSNNAPHGHSAGAAAPHYEEEPFESLEEMEAQTIGNLLPNDDDLLSGVTDGLDYVGQPNVGEGIEELDLFSSVGGMELGEDGFISGQRDLGLSGGNHNSQLREVAAEHPFGEHPYGEHPYGEHPSRTLFVRNINSNVEESDLRTLFEQFGDIRTLYTSCKHRGFVMVSYYDIRAARNAKTALQNKPLRRRNLDIHFSIPKDNPSDKETHQGAIVVFNRDFTVSNEELRKTFGVYGEIKEIRESPHRNHQRFIEFYDIRAAESTLRALNLSDFGGKIIMLEPTRPGGAKRSIVVSPPEIDLDEPGPYPRQSSSPSNITATYPGPFSNGGVTSSHISTIRAPGSPFLENMFHHGISSSVPKAVPSLARVESLGSTSTFPEACHSPGQLKVEYRGTPNFHPHSLPEYRDGLTNSAPRNSLGMAPNIGQFSRGSLNGHTLELNDAVFGGSGNNSRASPGQHYMWNNSPHPQPQGLMWPNSPTFFNGVRSPHPSQGLHALPKAPAHVLNGGLPINNHHVGSAPSPNHSLWDRRQTFGGDTPDSSGFHPASLGTMRISGNSPHHLDFVSQNMFPHMSGSCMDLSNPSKKVALLSPHQKCMMFPGRGQMIHSTSPYDSPTERGRARRNESSSNQGDNKKLFELDIDRIMRGDDNRTTLMIKNIPNKYTSKMLLNAIDENHRGTYNFIYLPIDFKNKCNVGYAFINMTEPSLIVPFYQAFNGKKWEKFNSEKVATLAYARIQGKDALVAHFQNSSLMNEDKRCRPILFNTDGPNAGDQVPFPMGAHIRSRPNKTRTVTSEENNQESSSNLSNGEENGDSSSGSGKDSD